MVLIEDDPGDALLVVEMLFDVAPEVNVRQFPTLRGALDQWPDDAECVLLDLGLPDAYGLSALEELRAHHVDVPVVVLTGRIDDASGPVALAGGAQDFLVKGQVEAAGLERSLRYAIERGRVAGFEREYAADQVRAEENARLQRGLLPSPLVDTDQVELAPYYRPGRERALLGGDFYDVVQTGSGVHLLIGDVSGHGPDEAALGVALRIAWRSLVLAGLTPPEVLLGVERVLLAERRSEEQFATVGMASLDLDLSRAAILLCGHHGPLLIQDDCVQELGAEPAPPLAVAPGLLPRPLDVELAGDWGLLLYTDGLVEGSGAPGAADRLGVGELSKHLLQLVQQSSSRQDIPPDLVTEAERRHGGPLPDDVAVLMIGTTGWWC